MDRRVKITVKGIVQGVGFRPFIYNLALKYTLSGSVKNSNAGVVIDVQGEKGALKKFIDDISSRHPPMARLDSVEVKDLRIQARSPFTIKRSSRESRKSVLVSPDLCTCKDCHDEIFDPKNRRSLYPFTACTNCGPRFSIVFDTPFDRERTSMRSFRMCPECKGEYKDPADRRFHSETNSCATCGPKLTHPVSWAVNLLTNGEIVAVKGLGGFHLVCDASNDRAVKKLRKAKGRDKKPFAIMVRNISIAARLADISALEKKLLESEERPIVLLKKKDRPTLRISDAVAPGNKYLGIMLPYTPVHYLILASKLKAIVATSANLAEEPILSTAKEVREKLSKITSYILDHDREIHSRIDDSVIRVIAGKPSMIRRARGYVPSPVPFPGSKMEVIAVGAEQKNTFALVKNGNAFISQHIGDLKSPESFSQFKQTIKHFEKVFQVKPRLIARDMHPEYLSSRYATGKKDVVPVQHHHAHVASCMAENSLNEKVIGVALDGMGMGSDGTIWGAEFLIADLRSFKRFAHLKYVPLPGADMASQEPWRMAVSHLYSAFGRDLLMLPVLKGVRKKDIELIISMIEKGINAPMASSMGRLFDAVSSLLGLCDKNTYEGEAASELEYAIEKSVEGAYTFDIVKEDDLYVIKPEKMIREIMKESTEHRTQSTEPRREISSKFHNTVAEMIVSVCKIARNKTNLNSVCLSGGCFQNKYLTEKTVELLKAAKFKVYTHSIVPANDGGISLGQAAVAVNTGSEV